jgi:hypothetical protein
LGKKREKKIGKMKENKGKNIYIFSKFLQSPPHGPFSHAPTGLGLSAALGLSAQQYYWHPLPHCLHPSFILFIFYRLNIFACLF